jgi:hypothetical protein
MEARRYFKELGVIYTYTRARKSLIYLYCVYCYSSSVRKYCQIRYLITVIPSIQRKVDN